MKRILSAVIILVLVFILSSAASADPLVLDAVHDGVLVYADKNTSSEVYQTLNKGQHVLIETSEAGWYAKLVESPSGEGQTLGWIQSADLSEHIWSEWTVQSAPTCTQTGLQYRVCKICGDMQTQNIDKLPHDWNSWIVRREATCTKEGEMFRTCKNCGTEQTKSIDKVDHSYSEWTVRRTATCTMEGEMFRTCRVCGKEQTKVIEKAAHDWSSWIVRREATCTMEGEMFRICGTCWKEQTKAIDKIPHDWSSWTVRREATCTEEGVLVRWCKVCGYEKTKSIEKIPHEFGEWVILREPTCVKQGEQAHWCKACNYKETEKIAKIPHDFSVWEIITEATDHSAGVRQRICHYCGKTEKESFDPKGTLRRKDKGDAVREIQQLMVDQKYLKKKDVDGSFGKGTETAVTKFQKDHGLIPDGVAWPQTIEALRHEFSEWETIKELSRFSDRIEIRACIKCGFQERIITKAEPSLSRGDKNKSVRCVQELLTMLGYKCGQIDSSYGGKVEKAWESFAAKHDLDFVSDQMRPGDLDVLVNTWIDALPEENWMGQGDKDSPVNLILLISPAGSEDGLFRYDWKLSNIGDKDCRSVGLLLGYGDGCDFTQDNLVLSLSSSVLKANSGNSRSGSFTIATDWAINSSPMYVCAVARTEDDGAVWTSNAVICDLDS